MTDGDRSGGMDGQRPVECQVFGDQLDALVRGTLSRERTGQLRLHAEVCAGCALELKVQEHLLGPSLEELEAQVPGELVASVWTGVQAGLQGVPDKVTPLRPRLAWLVPTLAAASVALLFSTGFLLVRAGRLADEAEALTRQVADQQRWLAALGNAPGADPVARTAALAGRNPFTRALSRTENISVGDLRRLLDRLPADRIILTQAQLEEVLRGRSVTTPPLLREALSRVDWGDGVRAHTLAQALEALGVSQEAIVSTADLVDLLS